MSTLSDVVKLAERRCPAGTAVPGVSDTAEYVADALSRLNDVAPRQVKHQITGDGTDEYSLGDDWSEGFSLVKRVRWVTAGDFDTAAEWLAPEDFEVEFRRATVTAEAVGTGDGATKNFALDQDFAIDAGSAVTVNAVAVASSLYQIDGGEEGSEIRFTSPPADTHAIVATYYTATPQIRFFDSPAATDLVLVEFTAPHILTGVATTLNANDIPFLADLAAALMCEAAAVAVLAVRDQDTQEDLALLDQGNRAEALERQAKRLRRSFNTHFGISDSENGGGLSEESPSSFAMVDIDYQPTSSTRYRHTHPTREF